MVERYPWWSGIFNEFDGEGTALMLIHDGDDRYHRAPAGWELESVERQEVTPCSFFGGICAASSTCVLGEAEAFWYARAHARTPA